MTLRRRVWTAVLAAALAWAPTPAAEAGPQKPARGAARVAIGVSGTLRAAAPKGRRTELLSLEEEVARRMEELLRGPLRAGTTAIYVADARTGEPVFAVRPDDALNPASNVKLLSTAAAIDLLGADFRYQTRVLGAVPHRNVVRGDLYLLGSFDPTLGSGAMQELAAALAASGVMRIDGDLVVGPSPTRDAVYRALLPLEITAGADGEPPTVRAPVGYEYLTFDVTAKTVTGKKARRARLAFREQPVSAPVGVAGVAGAVGAATPASAPGATVVEDPAHASGARLQVTISGTIAAGRTFTHWFWVRDRGRHAAHLLRAALVAQGIAVTGDVRKSELPAYLLQRVREGALPVVLARHQSAPLADIVARVNKRSINWLADRVIMTAAALRYGELPSMPRALDAMYDWLDKNLHVSREQILVDTGSGLSYNTQVSARHLVQLLRTAGGYAQGREHEPEHRAWLDSLAFSDGGVQDGTLRGRFRGSGFSGRLRGKTGTLSTSIALSGVLEVDPERPLLFSIVTNSSSPLAKSRVRAGHDRLIALLGQYVTKRAAIAGTARPAPASAPAASAAPSPSVTSATGTSDPIDEGLEPEDPEASGEEP